MSPIACNRFFRSFETGFQQPPHLCEMVTGRRAFEGEDVSQTMARVIEREPDLTRVPELDVRGFWIAVNDASLMRRCERFRDLARNRQRLVDRNRPLCDSLGERRSLNQLHDQRAHSPTRPTRLTRPIRLLKAMDRGDVRMIQRREQLRLALEARKPFGVRRESPIPPAPIAERTS
jgi:hypothetical protein